MEEEIKVTRGKLIAIFRHWNHQSMTENWPGRDDPEASADHFIKLSNDIDKVLA